jgi:copper chaperone CopZ
MKIAFFSEVGNFSGIEYPRNFENMRTDVAWSVALKAKNYSFDTNSFDLHEISKEVPDLGIIIVPKKYPNKAFSFYKRMKGQISMWSVMQEGPHWYYQDWNVPDQIEYINLLRRVDIIFCHNDYDKKYYQGLIPSKPCKTLPALMIEDAIPKTLVLPEHRVGTMIGGNWVSWYSGQDSYFIAQELGEQVYAPSMGRKQEYEDYIEDIIYSPYRNWSKWMIDLSTRKYAVHLMRTFAAGTFALNAAYLGIPCIGYRQLDTQATCFPELSVELGDLESARKIAKNLKENKLFYAHVSSYAKKAYHDNFREEIFIRNFNESLK